jgi:methylated-DNA-[protein]-cysteine S-methyltransferase
MTTFRTTRLQTPVGSIGLAWQGSTLFLVEMDVATDRTSWETGYRAGDPGERLAGRLRGRFGDVSLEPGDAAHAVPRALRSYFDGELGAIDALDVHPGGTDFQAAIWAELRRIGAGRTATYADLAARVGRAGAARAAGGAVGANPIPLVIPCHRIVGADGRLTGFGGGLARKRWLLEHEGAGASLTLPFAVA